MMVYINGKTHEFDKQTMTVVDILNKKQINKDIVVVEINKIIIDKKDYDSTYVKNNDKIEILSFIGGG